MAVKFCPTLMDYALLGVGVRFISINIGQRFTLTNKMDKEEIEHVKSSLLEICTHLPYNIRVCRIFFDSYDPCDPRGRASAVSYYGLGASFVWLASNLNYAVRQRFYCRRLWIPHSQFLNNVKSLQILIVICCIYGNKCLSLHT